MRVSSGCGWEERGADLFVDGGAVTEDRVATDKPGDEGVQTALLAAVRFPLDEE
jgi:hypothetical protein